MTSLVNYRCPICTSPLLNKTTSYQCANNHSFDLSKEGYLHLLPVQFKHSLNPGDNKSMVNARRTFLEQGYYQPLVDKIVTLYEEFSDQTGCVFDAGCGEGYYTHQHKYLTNQVYGVDIAKEAIKKAAKKYTNCHFSVGTLSQLPFEDNMFNWIVSIYAPILEQEFTRVLSSNGYLLTVTPAEKHLYELKELIYEKATFHDEEKENIKNLTLIHQENLKYEMKLETGNDTLNLLAMTPFAFKATENVKQQIAQQHNFICHADFQIRIYQKEM